METNTPESLSSLLNARMKATFALKSSFGHLANESKLALVPVIIKMYFMSSPPVISDLPLLWRIHKVVGARGVFSTSWASISERTPKACSGGFLPP